jgi:hypothetical protein
MISRRFPAAAIAVVVVFSLFLAVPRPAQAFLDKTRFVAHLGVAFFCFHHWVMKPYEEHLFDSGAPHRTATIVKAGVATLFAYHEVRVAEKIAQTSKDPLLQKMSGGVETLMGSLGSIGQRFKSGQFSPDDVKTLNSATTAVGSDAAAGGAPIKDVPVAVPGA